MSVRRFGTWIASGVLACGLSNAGHARESQSSAPASRPFVPLSAMHGAVIGNIAVDPRNPNFIYAGLDDAGGHMARSDDGGATWNIIAVGGPDDVLRAIAVDPVESSTVLAFLSTETGVIGPGTLYLSSDHGAHWNRFAHQPIGERGPASRGRGAVIDARGTTIVLADRRQGIFRSEDFGRTWTNPLPASQAQTYGIFTDPNDAKTLWTTGINSQALSPSAWVSHDYGRTWTESPMPILDPSTGSAEGGFSGTELAYSGATMPAIDGSAKACIRSSARAWGLAAIQSGGCRA